MKTTKNIFFPSLAKSFLLILTILFTLYSPCLKAQSICDYNMQKGYNLGVEYHDEPFEMLEQEDGRFLIWGTSYVPGNSFHITGLRVFANGNLDPSFGVLGKVDQVFSSRSTVTCATLQNDGKSLVGGYQSISNGIGSFKPYVARFNSDGSLDDSFGDGGSIVLDMNGEVHTMHYYNDSTIQVIAKDGGDFVIARITYDGQLDEDYNEVGYYSYPATDRYFAIGMPASTILPDSTSLVVSQTMGIPSYVSLTKVSPEGTIDADFGNEGNIVLTSDPLYSNTSAIRCEQAYDGNYLISGLKNSNDTIQMFVAKIDSASGALVTSFGDNGVVHLPSNGATPSIYKILKDEANNNYQLLIGSQDAITARMDDNGNLIGECGDILNVLDMNGSGTQGFTCGLIDQQGILRLSGRTGFFDPATTNGTQASNMMWAYYEEVHDPEVVGVTPEVIQINSPVALNIQGYGLDAATQVRMVSGSEILIAESFQVVDDEELSAVFYPENNSLGLYDLEVFLPNDTLYALGAVTIDDNYYIDGDVKYISRTSLRAGADFSFGLSYRNKSSVTMVATPLIIISNGDYSVDLSDMLDYNYQDDETMDELVAYFNSQGIDPSILNSSLVQQTSNRTINAVITPSLAPGQGGAVYGTQSMASVGSASSTTFFHPNPLLPPQSIVLPELIPMPTACSMESTKRAMLAVIPGLDIALIEGCYFPTYHNLQIQLAQRLQGPPRNIPINHYSMKLFWDMMQCVDPTYQLSQQEFQDFSTQWILYFTNSFILADGTPCNFFFDASEEVQPELEPEPEGPDCATAGNGVAIYCVDLGDGIIRSATQCQYDNMVAMGGFVAVVDCEEQDEEDIEDWTESEGSENSSDDSGGGGSGCNQASGYGFTLCARLSDGTEYRMTSCQFSDWAEIDEGITLIECYEDIEDITIDHLCDDESGLDEAYVCAENDSGGIMHLSICYYNLWKDIMGLTLTDCSDAPDDTPQIPNPDDDDDDLQEGSIPGEFPGGGFPGGDFPDSCDGCEEDVPITGEGSHDPNEKLGPNSLLGGTFINDPAMFYSIHFENVDTADLAATRVLILDTLDTSILDLSTFKFTYVSWGTTTIPIDDEVMTLDLRPTMPNLLRITTALDQTSGVVSCLFETLDTLSLMPTENVDQGFLPPNVNSPEGMGYISFEIGLQDNVEPGTVIDNQGHIFFDYNEGISTNIWSNTYDPLPPQSEVSTDMEYTAGMTVANISWESDDDDVLFYNVFYNEDGSDEWTLWKYHVNVTNSYFVGALDHTFYFMSIAIDSALNVEPIPDTYDAFLYMNPLSIEDLGENSAISIYPNPATDQVIISVEDIRFSQIILLDMMGRTVKKINPKNQSRQYLMSLEDVSNGMYNIQLLDEKGSVIGSEKIVVN